MYLSTIDHVKDWHRSHFIIHEKDWNTSGADYYFAEFKNGRHFSIFCERVGIYQKELIRRIDNTDENYFYQSFTMTHQLEYKSFWRKDELPENAKAIRALSNGRLVTCYFTNDGNTLTWYRPNPNAEPDVYNPLPIDEHKAHIILYGLY